MRQLTTEEKKLVEENHNLIYSYCYDNDLSIDMYYDLFAIALCKAAQKYDPSKGAFSTLSYYYFKNARSHEYELAKRKKRIPKELICSYNINVRNPGCNKDIEMIELISNVNTSSISDSIHNDFIFNMARSRLDDRECKVFDYLISGENMSDIGDMVGLSRERVRQIRLKIREKISDLVYSESLGGINE